MNKQRQKIWDKSNGKCWYCGCDLPEKGWHADHFEPVRRNWWTDTCLNPENENEENKVPTCAPCNLQKGPLSVEQFRDKLIGFVNSLNLYHNQYKFAKKYGLVTENELQVVEFWFENNRMEDQPNEAN